MSTTIKEVAKKAEVSITTVSLVLNDIPDTGIKQATRENVLRVANELNYSPNRLSKSLVRKKSDILGVLMPHGAHVFSDFHFSEVL